MLDQMKRIKMKLEIHSSFHPKSVPNYRIQNVYTETLGKIKLFNKMIVSSKRPKILEIL